MRLVHGAATDLGLVRRQNEDSFVGSSGLYAVCDGMGGARAGEVASEVACRVLTDMPKNAGAAELRDAIARANRLIRERSLADPTLSGMGTTLTAVTGTGSPLTVAQVGDSRAYLLHAGEFRQVTEDHSLVAEMIRRGQLTPEQAAVHPHRSIITRALGTEETAKPDIIELPLEVGDRVLICSDGLSGMVPDEELQGLLGAGTDPQETADELVAAALRNGGEDNVTVVVIFAVDSSGDEPGAGADAGPEEDSLDASGVSTAGIDGANASGPSIQGVGEDGFGPLVRTAGSGGRAGVLGGRRRLVLAIAVAVVAAAVAASAFLAFNSTVFFVGTTEGQVALFRGMPYKVMSVDLYRVEDTVPIRFEQLDGYLQERVDAHELVTKEEGLRFIRGLETSR